MQPAIDLPVIARSAATRQSPGMQYDTVSCEKEGGLGVYNSFGAAEFAAWYREIATSAPRSLLAMTALFGSAYDLIFIDSLYARMAAMKASGFSFSHACISVTETGSVM